MQFTISPNKNFKADIQILEKSIKNKDNFSFSKFCDGEWAVINNQKINNKEFWFDPDNENDQIKRKQLIEALQFKHDQYFIGVTCVNVFGLDTHRQMKTISGIPEDRITWADIWVNSNYKFYLNNILPLFKERPVILFCNEKGVVNNLPFKPYIVFPLKNNAWEYNWDIIEDCKTMIKSQKIKNMLFLFCCGPFGNILCHKLTECEPNNTYLDIGSTLNPFLQSAGFERDYYMGNNYFSNMTGAWDQ